MDGPVNGTVTGAASAKTAWITGAAGGLGTACARRLHQAGYALGLSDLSPDALEPLVAELSAAGGQVIGVGCDVSDSTAVDTCATEITSRLGSLDVLVTCAGILRDNLVHKMSDQDWHEVIGTHLTGTFYCARRAQREMVPKRAGKLIFLSSGASRGNRGQSNYSAAKAGIEGLTRTLAIELGPFGINVNAIAPGFIETAMTEQIAARTGVSYDEVKQAAAARVSLRRTGKPDDIAAAVAYLASEDASYLTGQVMFIRGAP
jgi:3-oxoacyl-[acyl-carrier protein] reductase